VYESWSNENDHGAIYCALVPNDAVVRSLSDPSWDLSIGQGRPTCIVRYLQGGEKEIRYNRFGNDAGVEPFVIVRDFHGVREKSVELVEEFRLLHNLFAVPRSGRLLRFDDAGEEHEVVRLEDSRVLVQARELRQFLAIKDASLVLQIDSVAHSPLTLKELAPSECDISHVASDRCVSFQVIAKDFPSRGNKSFSRLLGKRVIEGVAKSESGIWPYGEDQPESYPELIIGADENGDPARCTCDPGKLAHYFGANPNAQHYLTPTYFRREVLQRYYNNPQRYTVEDGAIRCAGLWLLHIDNHLTDVVAAYLGDLGRDLPESERQHWLPHNVLADEGISKAKWQRDFLAEPADPERPDLLFKYRFGQFQTAWLEKFGWPLFVPLTTGDAHLFSTLREPLNEYQGEFDSQVLALTKLLIDSLNEKQLVASLGSVPADTKGISKLELFLNQDSLPEAEKTVTFLRTLQSLRSTGVGHRKGSGYEKAAAAFDLPNVGLRLGFRTILQRATDEVLVTIGDHLLPSTWK